MRLSALAPVLALPWALLLGGCDSGSPRGVRLKAEKSAATAVASGTGAATSPTPSAAPATAPHAGKAGDIEWQDSLQWHTYPQGVELAKQTGKPILLMIYADWCSKCRALVPVFQRSDVRELASKMVAVRQDQDDPAPWLSDIGATDKYVPRIMFLSSDGVPLRQVTSGHPRYPFFYMAENPDVLLSSLKQALSI